MLKSKKLNNWSVIFTGSLVAVGLSLCVLFTYSARAAGGGTLIARSQLRRIVDPSSRSAFGSVLATVDGNGKETFQVTVTKLGIANFAPFMRLTSTPITNAVPTLGLAPLSRTNLKNGTWVRTYVGTGQAPADILPFFGNLSQLSNTEVEVAQPGFPDVTTIFTNVVGNVTNIINGIVIPNPGQTGTVLSVMWAPLYPLSSDPSSLSYHRHSKLVSVGDASPKAAGAVSISFNGSSGRSELKITAKNLTPGQQYTLFVADNTNQNTAVMVSVDNMTQKNLGSTATLVRDTQFGDPLPQQARDIGDLSGRIIQIRDAFDVVHLQGDMP